MKHSKIRGEGSINSPSPPPPLYQGGGVTLLVRPRVNKIKAIIKETRNEHRKDDSVNPNLLREMVKMKVREESLKYGASKKRETSIKEEEIERSIANLD